MCWEGGVIEDSWKVMETGAAEQGRSGPDAGWQPLQDLYGCCGKEILTYVYKCIVAELNFDICFCYLKMLEINLAFISLIY